MEPVKVRNVIIGKGKPKICVPIVAAKARDILQEARTFAQLPIDMVEWRVDWYEDAPDLSKVLKTAGDLRECLKDIPFLFTFRTAKEGGEKALAAQDYIELNKAAAESGYVDLLDVELFTGDEAVAAVIEHAHRRQVKVIVSSHDFRKTPSRDEILGRLRKMQELGADIPKIAVMPLIKKDVLTLLEATLEMSEHYARGPIITMSMAGMGVASRLVGETFGSAVTYGAAGKQSAPGQVDAGQLAEVLAVIHESQIIN
ncbi:MAG: type I 3-dehydroquinate dehydratase [Hungatella sp.]|nr:type I 3-dehydroquinate dehydratase [Hungatella sp.]